MSTPSEIGTAGHLGRKTGKGKTIVAWGLPLQAAGQGLKVFVDHFMKGSIQYGELKSAKRLSPTLTIHQMGRETFVSKTNPDPVDIEWAQKDFAPAKEVILIATYKLGDENLAI